LSSSSRSKKKNVAHVIITMTQKFNKPCKYQISFYALNRSWLPSDDTAVYVYRSIRNTTWAGSNGRAENNFILYKVCK